MLARDAVSPVALPPWDNASMDGYAVRDADVRGATASTPIILPVLGTVAAGGRANAPLPAGTALRIMTGAPMPQGADTVIRIEDTDRGTERVAIVSDRDAGKNVRSRGEDLRVGQVAFGARRCHRPRAARNSRLDRRRGPARSPDDSRVAVMSTGDELVDVDRFHEVLAGTRIVSSNGYSLRASVQTAGAEVVDLGIVGDNPVALSDALAARVQSAMRS